MKITEDGFSLLMHVQLEDIRRNYVLEDWLKKSGNTQECEKVSD
jgi:hypothetical protein